jgi:hypothetical protein
VCASQDQSEDFQKCKRPRTGLQLQSSPVCKFPVLTGPGPVKLQSFSSPRTGLPNTRNKSEHQKKKLLGLEKELRCNLLPEMELKFAKNVIFKTLNKIKDVA